MLNSSLPLSLLQQQQKNSSNSSPKVMHSETHLYSLSNDNKDLGVLLFYKIQSYLTRNDVAI